MAKKGESHLRSDIVVPALRRAGLTVSTVEGGGLGGTPGIPDLHYAGRYPNVIPTEPDGTNWEPRYVEGWIELKILREEDIAAKALTSTIPVVSGLGHFTPKQRVWLTKHSRAGGRCHLLLEVKGVVSRYYLFDGLAASEGLGRTWLFRDFGRHGLLDRSLNPKVFPDPVRLLRGLLRNKPDETP